MSFKILNSLKLLLKSKVEVNKSVLNYYNRTCTIAKYSKICYGDKRKIGVLGVPFCKGQLKNGTDVAPKMLRDLNLIQKLRTNENIEVKDYGDIEYSLAKNLKPLENANNYDDVFAMNYALALKVQEILKENDQYILLGGDHSLGIGSVAGHLAYDPNIAVIWIDAHADINTNLSSNSGSMHGMPVSFFLEELKECYATSDIQKFVQNHLPAKKLFYIGLRDVEAFETSVLKKMGIMAFGMLDVEKYGIAKILEKILKSIGNDCKIHISFDVDSIDPFVVPSTGTPVLGGLNSREVFYVLETLDNTGRIQGFDLVEVNPLLGDERDVSQTMQVAFYSVQLISGHKRIQE